MAPADGLAGPVPVSRRGPGTRPSAPCSLFGSHRRRPGRAVPFPLRAGRKRHRFSGEAPRQAARRRRSPSRSARRGGRPMRWTSVATAAGATVRPDPRAPNARTRPGPRCSRLPAAGSTAACRRRIAADPAPHSRALPALSRQPFSGRAPGPAGQPALALGIQRVCGPDTGNTGNTFPWRRAVPPRGGRQPVRAVWRTARAGDHALLQQRGQPPAERPVRTREPEPRQQGRDAVPGFHAGSDVPDAEPPGSGRRPRTFPVPASRGTAVSGPFRGERARNRPFRWNPRQDNAGFNQMESTG